MATTDDDATVSGPEPPRRRRFLTCGAVVALASVGVAAIGAANGSAAEAPPAAVPSGISLSMTVEPGEAVPMELITEQAAASLYAGGFRGQGIDIALIDSGVAPVAGLDQPGKILYGPDLSNEGGQPNLANLDTYGHGTHLAGIMVGNDGEQLKGIADQSRVVSVKVAGATGETDIAQVIAGIDWVIDHKNDNGLNIRVLNLSLGVAGLVTNQGDPLSAAVERAWDAGIVVVAAAGNRGNESAGIDSPAISPYVIAVGGIESRDSEGVHDLMATWSSGGNEHRTPDVVAPGRSILSLRVPGSMLDQLHPGAVVGETYFRGTGTSQSAAVVSGFTAALLSADPSLTPDQVKFLFELFAADMVEGRYLDGSGKIDVDEMFASLRYKAKAPRQNHPRALPTCSNTDADTPALTPVLSPVVTPVITPVVTDVSVWQGRSKWTDVTAVQTGATALSSVEATGSVEGDSLLLDAPMDAMVTTAETVDAAPSWWTPPPPQVDAPCGTTWTGGGWSGATWSGGEWSGATWSGATWSGATWSGGIWSGATWSGATWSGATWSGATWSGATWSGATWSGATWSGATWSGKKWGNLSSLSGEIGS